MAKKEQLDVDQKTTLLAILKKRFEQNMHRHPSLVWSDIEAKLIQHPEKLWSINEMEHTGGEPDVVIYDVNLSEIAFYDCAVESPKGRRSLCYDREALESRKDHPPTNNVLDIAKSMNIELLTEQQYTQLQTIEKFDLKTSSWVESTDDIRAFGGAIFCDYRYGRVFTYHNGAQSYYASRGFRGLIRIE